MPKTAKTYENRSSNVSLRAIYASPEVHEAISQAKFLSKSFTMKINAAR
jgi:hypothetical protein